MFEGKQVGSMVKKLIWIKNLCCLKILAPIQFILCNYCGVDWLHMRTEYEKIVRAHILTYEINLFLHKYILKKCCMCKSNGESVSYLLLHCPIAQELWNMIFTLFGTVWVMPRGVYDLFACWSGKVGKSDSGAIWKAVPHCLMWCLWRERNSRTFSGEEQSVPALKFTFLQTLFEWLKASNLISAHSVAEMLDTCSF